MSCALPRENPASDSFAATPVDARGNFYEHMANGLHALAQPLTVLRGALGVLTGPAAKKRDERHYLEMSTTQIDRLCELLSQMQILVDTHQFEAELATVDLDALISGIVEETEGLVRRAEIKLAVENPEKGLTFIADQERTTQALLSTLKVFASVSLPGDVIRLWILPQDEFVEFVVENENGRGRSFNSCERLSLSLVEANVRTQHGFYHCVEDPIRVRLKLPAHDINRNNDRAEVRDSSSAEWMARLPQSCAGSRPRRFQITGK